MGTQQGPDQVSSQNGSGSTKHERAARPKWVRVIWVVGSILAGVITVATIVIPWVADASQRPTSSETLVGDLHAKSAEPSAAPPTEAVASAITAFARDSEYSGWISGSVSVDADWSSFPLDSAAEVGCGDAQEVWLSSNGIPSLQPSVSGELLNTATTGGSLSLRNLRAEGEFVPQDPPRLRFSCYVGGIGAVSRPIWTSLTLGDNAPAVFIENTEPQPIGTETTPPNLIGTPFVHNLAPGEILQLTIFFETLDRGQDFVGRIVTDVIADGHTSEHVLAEGHLYASPGSVEAVSGYYAFGQLHCIPAGFTVDDSSISAVDIAHYACTPLELQARASAQ